MKAITPTEKLRMEVLDKAMELAWNSEPTTPIDRVEAVIVVAKELEAYVLGDKVPPAPRSGPIWILDEPRPPEPPTWTCEASA